jgi:energy-coupling factor transporter ATP-binding protein EcfA2
MDAFLRSFPVIEDECVIPLSIPKYEEVEPCTLWVQNKDYFIPDISVTIHDKLPPGVYKMELVDRDWQAHKIDINTDELYAFSNDCTSDILEEVSNFWKKKDLYQQFHIAHKRGILLCGAPGCGKTSIIQLLVKQIVEEMNGLVFVASTASEFSGLSHMLSNTIRQIEKDRPIITIIEDVDQLITSLGGDACILDFLDGSTSIENHLVILTSNNTTDLTDAILRPSRIDLIYEIPNPTSEVRKLYFQKKEIDPEIITDLVKKTEGFSFAELKEVFVAIKVLGKTVTETIQRIKHPFTCKDYLRKNKKIQGI